MTTSSTADMRAAPPMSSPSPALARVMRGDLCSGCGACALLAPDAVTMKMTPQGFLRPHQTAAVPAPAEADIAAVCPGLGQQVVATGRPVDPLWGPFLEMRIGWSTDPDLRHRASSGGGLSALLVHLLESGTVDAVVQIGAGEPAVSNKTTLSRQPADVVVSAGSRYAPSDPLSDLGRYLDSDGRYAFVGKPCDVAALRALESRDPRVAERFPYMISFFCAGVPSERGAEAVLDQLGTRSEDVVAFRYRGFGWPGRATATLRDGSERSMTYMESWGRVLSSHVQHRCKLCADGTGKAADIAFADAWEADERGYPLFEEADGTSLVVVRTPAGQQLLQRALDSGHMQTEPFDTAKLTGIQPGQFGRRTALAARLVGQRLSGMPIPRYRGLTLLAAARRNSLSNNLRNLMGSFRRALKLRMSNTRRL